MTYDDRYVPAARTPIHDPRFTIHDRGLAPPPVPLPRALESTSPSDRASPSRGLAVVSPVDGGVRHG